MDSSVFLSHIKDTLPEVIDDEVACRLLEIITAITTPNAHTVVGVGTVVHTAELVKLLGISRQAIHKATKLGRIVAIQNGRQWIYPIWQISNNGRLLDGIAAVQGRLLNRIDLHAAACWWVKECRELENTSPAQWLSSGRDLTRAVAAAEHYANAAS